MAAPSLWGSPVGNRANFTASAREGDVWLRHRIGAHQQGSTIRPRHQRVLSAQRNSIGSQHVHCKGLALAGEACVVMAPKNTPVGDRAAFSASFPAAITLTQGRWQPSLIGFKQASRPKVCSGRELTWAKAVNLFSI